MSSPKSTSHEPFRQTGNNPCPRNNAPKLTMPMSHSPSASHELARLRWQCRRGMRELDQLLCRYLELRYPDAGDAEKAAFAELLSLPDPELVGYLLQKQIPESPQHARVVQHILGLPVS